LVSLAGLKLVLAVLLTLHFTPLSASERERAVQYMFLSDSFERGGLKRGRVTTTFLSLMGARESGKETITYLSLTVKARENNSILFLTG